MRRPTTLFLCSPTILGSVLLAACGTDAPLAPATAGRAAIQVSVSTAGAVPDPDGYVVYLDGRPEERVSANGSVTLSGIGINSGTHQVALTDVASHCSVAGGASQEVALTRDGPAAVRFSVTCGTPAGRIRVDVTTVGADLDPDGYTVVLDAWPLRPVGVNGSVTFDAVVDGSHEVTLTGARPACLPDRNPQNVTVDRGASASVAFHVTCRPAPTGRLLAWGPVGDSLAIFSLAADGSDVVNLTPGFAAERGRWSPDGQRIVFESHGEVYQMGADGSAPTRLTTGGGSDPAWSPDGTRVVYAGSSGLVVANTDGSDPIAITSGRDGSPAWSPDGRTIAFSRSDAQKCRSSRFSPTLCTVDLFTVRPDGAGLTRLTTNDVGIASAYPVWSPDGTRIAYAHSTILTFLVFQRAAWDLWAMAADGSGAVDLTSSAGVEELFPVWSPDGAWIAYARLASPPGRAQLGIAEASGLPLALFTEPGLAYPSSWK